MAKYILDTVGDLNWMAIVPLVIFMVVFIYATVRVLTQNKSHIEKMSKLPLEEE